jgi:hypothetical protein
MTMSVPDSRYSTSFPMLWLWAYLIHVNLRTFQCCDYERTWFTLLYELSNVVTMSVPDSRYSTSFPMLWLWAYLIHVTLRAFQCCDYERTWFTLLYELSNVVTMSVPDSRYSTSFPNALNSIFTFSIIINTSKEYRLESGPSCPWSYGSWIYNYLCNQRLSPLMLWVRISIRARRTA